MPKPIETPPPVRASAKTARDENFPVGSRLIAARFRPHILAYYRFARAADDIADNPELAPADKLTQLTQFEEALLSNSEPVPVPAPVPEAVAVMRKSLLECAIAQDRCLDLLYAFMQDARKSRRETWNDLLDYCRLSANPVGRYLLDLHGESNAAYRASDALCTALQVLNHLQDCREDYYHLNRVYLPMDWLLAEGLTAEVLRAEKTPLALRRVFDHCLDQVDLLLKEAASLPHRLKDRGLAMESAVILRLALRLSNRLRTRDPLAKKVALHKIDFLDCGLRGVASVIGKRLLGEQADSRTRETGANG